jgi:hypothetical protein
MVRPASPQPCTTAHQPQLSNRPLNDRKIYNSSIKLEFQVENIVVSAPLNNNIFRGDLQYLIVKATAAAGRSFRLRSTTGDFTMGSIKLEFSLEKIVVSAPLNNNFLNSIIN